MKRNRLILLVICFSLIAPGLFATPGPEVITEFYEKVNRQRSILMLRPVERDIGLEALAETYARECAAAGGAYHHLWTVEQLNKLYRASGARAYIMLGEILQGGSPFLLDDADELMYNFNSSPLHKSYIEDPNYSGIGAAFFRDGDRLYFVAYLGEERSG